MRAHRSHCFSSHMSNRHLWQLKKSKSWGLLLSYQLNSTANPAHSPQNRPNFEFNGLDWQCCLAGSSKRAPKILIFSIAIGSEYSSCVKSIATFAPTFFGYIISVLASVVRLGDFRIEHFFKVFFSSSLSQIPSQKLGNRNGQGGEHSAISSYSA